MAAQVIDVNVPIVANGSHDKANLECIRTCIRALRNSRGNLILVDNGQRIFTTYRKYLSQSGQPGPGDAWFKWLWLNQANRHRCRLIPVTSVDGVGNDFVEYPSDPELGTFDPDDRIFVAVALASNLTPEILNASDTDWWPVRAVFARNGVNIRFLCESLMTDEG